LDSTNKFQQKQLTYEYYVCDMQLTHSSPNHCRSTDSAVTHSLASVTCTIFL